MQITHNHPLSKNGIPVILDDYGNLYHYESGISAALTKLGWSRETAALEVGCEPVEFENQLWNTESPSRLLLDVLKHALEQSENPLETE
jgi:hypothetical protein